MDPTLQKGQYVNKRFRADPGDVQVKDADDGDGDRKRIRMPVSSTATDRDGDQFSEKGLTDLHDQINEGNVPMFLDHGRGSRGGYYGTLGMVGRWDSAEIDDQGDIKVLYAEGTPTKANDDANAMVDLIEDDMPVGASVGFRVLDYDGDREDGYKFHKSDLLEISNVGIPSNPVTVNTIGSDDGVAAKGASDAFAPALLQMMQAHASASQAALPDGQEYSFQTDSAATPENTMSNTDNDNTDDTTNDDLLKRLVSLQEGTVEKMDEQDERLKELEARLDEQKDEDDEDGGDNDDDDDDGDDDDDDDDGDDGKSLTIVAGADADEATIKRIEEMRDLANDDGEIDLAESKTTLFASDDSTDDQTDSDPREEWGM